MELGLGLELGIERGSACGHIELWLKLGLDGHIDTWTHGHMDTYSYG